MTRGRAGRVRAASRSHRSRNRSRGRAAAPIAAPALLFAPGCVAASGTMNDTAVRGRVVLAGEPPPPGRRELEEEMVAVCGEREYVDELWRVTPEGGVAGCVVVLHPPDGATIPPPDPATDVPYEKVGPRYEPRVLVVPAGTTVLLRNRNSPCRGFVSRFLRNPSFTELIPAEGEARVRLERPEAVRVYCDARPYMRGVIVVVDTPDCAVTDARGGFAITGIEPGTYRLRPWHEGTGWVRDADPVTVASGRTVELTPALAVPGDPPR